MKQEVGCDRNIYLTSLMTLIIVNALPMKTQAQPQCFLPGQAVTNREPVHINTCLQEEVSCPSC